MKIHLISDIHLEFADLQYTPPECDVVVLAGDIMPGVEGLTWAREIYGEDVVIVYLAGNHEFYGKRLLFDHYIQMRMVASQLGIVFLQNDAEVINGVLFVGGTLWTDFNNGNPLDMIKAKQFMNDYTQIKTTRTKKLLPYIVLNEFNKTRDYIEDILGLDEYKDMKKVVCTHHAPSEESCYGKWRGDPNNMLFASRLEGLILDTEPDIWVHGHIHCSADYLIGKTRVLCNPRAYPGETDVGFQPNLIVDV